MLSVETLLYVLKGNKVLLILKKRGLGAGLYNGIGGKVEDGETPEECIIREAHEEVGIKVRKIEWIGLLEFINFGKNEKVLNHIFVHVFKTGEFDGNPVETEEAIPYWFDINKLPYENMWEDDKYWLPLLIKGEKFYGKFVFKEWKLERGKVYKLKS